MKTLLLALIAALSTTGQITQYTVTAKADQHTDFSKLKTYEWEVGWNAPDRDVHQQCVAAINRELTALGFAEGAPGHSDVTVAYYSLRRTDMNLNWKSESEDGPLTYPAGTLVVEMLEPGTRRELFTARADAPIDLQPDRLRAIIDEKVARMFALYPTHAKRRR